MDRHEALEARKAIHGDATLRGLSETFKVLGDPTLCVSDLAAVAAMSESAVSHQLRIMKTMRLVRYRKEGKKTYYMLDDNHIEQLIALGMRHVSEG